MKARAALGRGLAIAAIAAVGVPVGGTAQSGPADPAGPLFIVGGGRQPDALVARFVELAGGPGMARIAVIPLASSVPDEAGLGKTEHFREFGAESFVLLTAPDQADDAAVLERLDGATGIWFTGGDQSRITAALDGTSLLGRIRARNAAGVAIGGTSAGAAIMSPLMITGNQALPGEDTLGYHGDTFARIARNVIEVVPGFGLLPGVIVDQHFVRRERHNRLLSAVLERPDHIGVGIDESTALEATPGGTWRVHGASVVVIYDARGAIVSDEGAPALGAGGIVMHLLPAGSTYDPRSGTLNIETRAP
ncbi:MAG TPA: cyanophycinase [Longimicrobiales bacterium]|nr:cyanophycinase [Longimicrobiales bacterium]